MDISLSARTEKGSFPFLASTEKPPIHGHILVEEMKTAVKTNDLGKKIIASMALGLLLGTLFSFSWTGSILIGLGIGYLSTSDEMDRQIQSADKQWNKIGNK